LGRGDLRGHVRGQIDRSRCYGLGIWSCCGLFKEKAVSKIQLVKIAQSLMGGAKNEIVVLDQLQRDAHTVTGGGTEI